MRAVFSNRGNTKDSMLFCRPPLFRAERPARPQHLKTKRSGTNIPLFDVTAHFLSTSPESLVKRSPGLKSVSGAAACFFLAALRHGPNCNFEKRGKMFHPSPKQRTKKKVFIDRGSSLPPGCRSESWILYVSITQKYIVCSRLQLFILSLEFKGGQLIFPLFYKMCCFFLLSSAWADFFIA